MCFISPGNFLLYTFSLFLSRKKLSLPISNTEEFKSLNKLQPFKRLRVWKSTMNCFHRKWNILFKNTGMCYLLEILSSCSKIFFWFRSSVLYFIFISHSWDTHMDTSGGLKSKSNSSLLQKKISLHFNQRHLRRIHSSFFFTFDNFGVKSCLFPPIHFTLKSSLVKAYMNITMFTHGF